MEKLQFGEMATADFEENTITLEMQEGFWVKAGTYAIIEYSNLDQKMKIEEFVKTL